MNKYQTSSIGHLTKGLFLTAACAQAALADQPQPATTALPELMMAQLQHAVQTATAEVLPLNATVTIGSSGMVFPPLALPNPADPDFVDSLNQNAGGLEAWTGWGDWRENLVRVIGAGSLEADLAASSFLDDTNAAVTQAVYGTGPNFDLLSIYQVPEPDEPAPAPAPAQAESEPETASDAGFFSQ